MEQENISDTPQPVPGTPAPLQQVSEQRINQLRIPQSPSVPAYLNEYVEPQHRRGSDLGVAADVRSKIAFFQSGNTMATNSFAIASSPTRTPVRSAFNSPTKHGHGHSRVNSTVSIPTNPDEKDGLITSLQAQLDASKGRERLIAERVESLIEQYTNEKSRGRYETKEYEKEIKAMKRQVHKAELALIRCQAELEESRKEQEGFKVRAEHERVAKERSRQDAFERARTLAGNMEELEVVKRERDMLLGENEALKSVQESMQLAPQDERSAEVREIGVQAGLETITAGGTTVPIQQECTCRKGKEVEVTVPDFTKFEVVHELQSELTWIRSQLKREQDLVHFMNMQCQFRACPCRMAEKAGVRFVHDYAYDQRQQKLAEAKGVKRKAEDELPLPKYTTLREKMEQKSREKQVEFRQLDNPSAVHQVVSAEETSQLLPPIEIVAVTSGYDQEMRDLHTDAEPEDDITLRAMLTPGSICQNDNADMVTLVEAAEIPLPSPRSDDLEPTILLEDMTQVMVEPEAAATANHFAFSTSTSSRRPVESETPIFRQSHSAVPVSAHDDLFDIRPPRHLPPRPSTVMGVRTVDVESPIRMVPPSPEHRISLTPGGSPPRYRTMQIPLKDSPTKHAITQRRSHSRPRNRSRARSPTPGRRTIEADSPSAQTCFPVTPKQKHERQTRPNAQLHALHSAQTSTTTVPLRGMQEDDVFSPEKPFFDRSYPLTQFNLDNNTTRGRQPLAESDANVHGTVLPGTPISREAALAQIRARRDRARSLATRKGQQSEDEGRQPILKTPKSAARRGVMLNLSREANGRDISNLSQASAPARF